MDKLLFGLSTTAIGMLVVFFGLVVLIACISCMHALTGKKENKPAPAAAAAPAPAPAEAEAPLEDDFAVIAAITAALTAVWQGENAQTGFVVRRVRRIQTSTARARAARDEQIFSRL